MTVEKPTKTIEELAKQFPDNKGLQMLASASQEWRRNAGFGIFDYMVKPKTEGRRIRALQGDITQLSVDAIVNAAHESLEVGGGVNGAIHRAAGPELLAECRKLGKCKEGDAKITKGGRLSAKFVIHTVGPIWAGGAYCEAELLASCYRRSLEVAVEHGVQSVAFPSVSTGVHGYDVKAAATTAVTTVSSFLAREASVREVIFCCFSAEDFAVYERILEQAPA